MTDKKRVKRKPFEDTETVDAGDLLGDDCKAKALGHGDNTYFFSDPVGQVRAVRAGEMTPNGLISLFLGDTSWMENHCPAEKKKKGQDRTSWHNPSVVALLIGACKRAGFFDPSTQTRGTGIWPYGDVDMVGETFAGSDQIVIHTGDQVGVIMYSTDGGMSIDWHKPGVKLGAYVYPAAPRDPAPGEAAATQEDVGELLKMIRRWKYRDGDIVPPLVLGLIGVGIAPALLPYRPSGWVQGRSGAGKSTLIDFIKLCQQGRPLKYDNATAAGIRDDFKKRNDTRLVIINEAEVSDNNGRLNGLIEMARYVYTSGEGTYRRGGSGGAAHDITASFLFAAVEPPPLLPQDANRMAMIRLGALKITSDQAETFDEEMPKLARSLAPKLVKRFLVHWPRYMAIFNGYRATLLAEKHSIRMSNTLGTLLAMAWLLSNDDDPADVSDYQEWTKQLDATLLGVRDDHRTTEAECLMRLMTHQIAADKSSAMTPLGEYVRLALYNEGDTQRANNGILKRFGLAVTHQRDKETGERFKWVAVSNRHEALASIYRGSRWANGAWSTALRLTSGAQAGDGVWFSGGQDRCTLLPVKLFPDAPFKNAIDEVQDLDNPAPAPSQAPAPRPDAQAKPAQEPAADLLEDRLLYSDEETRDDE